MHWSLSRNELFKIGNITYLLISFILSFFPPLFYLIYFSVDFFILHFCSLLFNILPNFDSFNITVSSQILTNSSFCNINLHSGIRSIHLFWISALSVSSSTNIILPLTHTIGYLLHSRFSPVISQYDFHLIMLSYI